MERSLAESFLRPKIYLLGEVRLECLGLFEVEIFEAAELRVSFEAMDRFGDGIDRRLAESMRMGKKTEISAFGPFVGGVMYFHRLEPLPRNHSPRRGKLSPLCVAPLAETRCPSRRKP